jgi:hypothetical protein
MKILCVAALAAAAFGQVTHQHHAPGSAEEYIRVLEDPQIRARETLRLPPLKSAVIRPQ